ncbi:uncharacterized protein LOC141915150 isoform X2 [Tubulanus polymorphus]|uniref:uncharacterized protein LOC141915150 isoform X2 n=1 Tax=Tubulanus polymorphus TaxID=672921 RepID=UPI003DA4027B
MYRMAEFSLWIYFLLVLIPFVSSNSSWQTLINTARCRSFCVKQFLFTQEKTRDRKCSKIPDCARCWFMCEEMYNLYDPVCDPSQCCHSVCVVYGTTYGPCSSMHSCKCGCQTACFFRYGLEKRNFLPLRSRHAWKFSKPKISDNGRVLRVTWQRPVPREIGVSNSTLVYVLLARETGSRYWHEVMQTATTSAGVKTGVLPNQAEFKIVAINETGLIGQIVAKKKRIGNRLMQVTRTGDGPDPNQIRVKTDRSEGIATAYITWNGTTSKYRVNWGIEEANKQCESDMGDYREARVFGNGTKPMFPRLMFGARYWVEIKNMMTGASYPKKVFKTPFCANLDPSCLTCRQEDDIGRPTGHSVAEPEYPLEVTVTKGPVWSKEKGKVLVSISWQNITHHKTLYTVKWAAIELQKSSTHVQSVSGTTAPTNRTSIQLTLLPDLFYKVEVEATFNDEKGYTHIKSSDVKTVNTTMPSQLPINAAGKSDMSTIIIIVVTVGLLAAALIAFIIIYRRYKGEIAIVKTVAANSNSYKSSYAEGMIRRTPLNFLVSRQANRPELLVTVKDEWEIEHSDLVLGHVLGQGAFGKVIVGELSEQTVAVKVLKDNVPLSYKEDFLQEIALMKKLGPHPHIVSLIGACTLRDPVTLVLEYMPHGNLQNFLKKCRLQGTISLTDDGIQELEYEDDGINWVISASDMLSFARQVAMAMEYIVEKKFVHRDLAARNILVGPNKFVKLCDFGLSRDVYGTNLYHKVTNGKLPLKWMALESLRDRIFTTYSDIWSYGILLYEIATLGGSPYPNIALADLYTMLCRGYRMDKPSNCSPELYETMVQCWDERPLTRPSFTAIREKLEDLMVLDKDYLRLDNIDVPVNPCDNTSDLENDSPSEGEQQEECTPLTIDTDNVEPYLESIPAIVIESTSV